MSRTLTAYRNVYVRGFRYDVYVRRYRIGSSAAVGAAVASARRERGLTQSVLAEQAGVSRAWLAKLEAGHRGAEIGLVIAVLRAMGLEFAVEETAFTSAQQEVLAAWERSRG